VVMVSSYQLALMTPGISPAIAASLNVSRETPYFLRNPRRRPLRRHRFTNRTELEFRGNFANEA